MTQRNRMQLAAVLAAGAALLAAGCSDRSNETVGQKVDNAAANVAAATGQVADKAAGAIDDATITTKIKAAVLAEPGLKALQIKVDTRDGNVTLNGTVDTPALKERAMQVARAVEGVKTVSDQLVVKPS